MPRAILDQRIKKRESRTLQPVLAPYGKEQRLFLYLTCLYIFIWYLQLGSRVSILGVIRFEFILGVILSIASFLKILNDKNPPSPLLKPIIFYYTIIIFYTIFSYDHALSWEIFFNRVFKFSMLALFFAAFVRTPHALKIAVATFLLAMLKLGQEGFVGWYWGGMVWENQGVPRLHGSTDLYGHPNSYSGMAVGCLPFIYFLFPECRKMWQRYLLTLLFLFCIIIIVFTASRTGYVATLLLAVYALFRLKGKHRLAILTIITLALVASPLILPQQYLDRFKSIYTMEEIHGGSIDARKQILSDALHVAITKPWGVGVAAFPSVRKSIFGRTQDTHNLYLELLTNLSIVGLLAFFWLIGALIKTNLMLQSALSSQETEDSRFLIALSKAVVGFILARLFLGMFGMDTYEIYWWFATGLTISLYRSSQLMLSPKIAKSEVFNTSKRSSRFFLKLNERNVRRFKIAKNKVNKTKR